MQQTPQNTKNTKAVIEPVSPAPNPWDDRYASPEFIYGTRPNAFFEAELAQLQPGKSLFVFEGEGRNAVHAAECGWDVVAFDGSAVAREKALNWAKNRDVVLNYSVADAQSYDFGIAQYDLVVLIFAHLPPSIRPLIHHRCVEALKPGGRLILEAFRPEQLPLTSGGPKDPDWLYTEPLLRSDFQGLTQIRMETAAPRLDEGPLHQGTAATIRVTGVR